MKTWGGLNSAGDSDDAAGLDWSEPAMAGDSKPKKAAVNDTSFMTAIGRFALC